MFFYNNTELTVLVATAKWLQSHSQQTDVNSLFFKDSFIHGVFYPANSSLQFIF